MVDYYLFDQEAKTAHLASTLLREHALEVLTDYSNPDKYAVVFTLEEFHAHVLKDRTLFRLRLKGGGVINYSL